MITTIISGFYDSAKREGLVQSLFCLRPPAINRVFERTPSKAFRDGTLHNAGICHVTGNSRKNQEKTKNGTSFGRTLFERGIINILFKEEVL